MEFTIVIKVKYGKTLRRFNARVDEAGKLELTVDGLREKIFSLFKLSPKVDLRLTYLDEDGDSVTLADDEDLHDVMRQSLDPLRITANVNAEKGNTSSVRSSGDSIPMNSSPRASHPLPNLNNPASEIFKALPQQEALSKLLLDLATKAVTSSPHLPELVQNFSKMLHSYMVADFGSQIGTVSSTQSVGSESAKPSSMTKEPEVSGGDGANPKVVAVPISVNQPIRYEKKVNSRFNTIPAPEPRFVNLNADHLSDGREEVKNFSESTFNAGAGKPDWENIKAVASSVLGTDDKDVKKLGEGWNSIGTGASSNALFSCPNQNSAPKTVNFERNSSARLLNQNVAGECPFAGMPVASEPAVPYTHFGPQVHPFKRSYSQGGVVPIFHKGVHCDGCGAYPITGPRFKSKVKEDYDLCSICFAEMGSEADFMRLDHPMPYRLPHSCKNARMKARVNPPPLPQTLGSVVKPNWLKLDSQFIADVNVMDGTMMAPSTPFTKIWRMRNNGTLVWPQGTQLVWIGGDRLSASPSAGLQIPVEGLAVENELEVAVDLMAPELPGRYISYWKMASPAGQKFGQRIWVLIQVDASMKDSALDDNWQGLNLNLPPESNGLEGTGSQAINVEPIVVDGRLPISKPSKRASDLVDPFVVPLQANDQDLDFPINDNLLVNGTPVPAEGGPTAVSYPTVDSFAPVVDSLASPPMLGVSQSSVRASGEEDVERILLRELEEMGFKQVDVNKDILRKNEYNLEQSVDDLCGVCEWDPILEELQGFIDIDANKKLLMNNGSI